MNQHAKTKLQISGHTIWMNPTRTIKVDYYDLQTLCKGSVISEPALHIRDQ